MRYSEMPERANFINIANTTIENEGITYKFGDLIENEWVSKMPEISHRMRSQVVKGTQLIDSFMLSLDTNINNQISEGLSSLNSGLENNTNILNNKIAENKSTLDNYINSAKSQIERKINEVDSAVNNSLATDTRNGLINFNTVKELASNKINELLPESKITELSFNKMKEYGLGLTTTSSGHINDYRPNGFYAFGWQGGGIGNKTTGVFNIQYADRYGVQLSITQEDKTKAYIRAKNNGSWTNHKELMQVEDFNLYANAYLGNSEVKVLNGRNAVAVKENDILVYDTNNKRYYYKSKIVGNITIPTEENTEKLMLGSGSGMGFLELKRKLTIGGVEEVS